MRRRPLAVMLVLLSASLILGGNALLDAVEAPVAARMALDR